MYFRSFIALSTVAALTACSTTTVTKLGRQIQADSKQAQTLVKRAPRAVSQGWSNTQATVEEVEGIWLPFKKASDMDAQASIREAGKRRFSVNRDFRTIQDVAERVTFLTGIPVIVSPDVAAIAAQQSQGQQGQPVQGATAAALRPAGATNLPLISGGSGMQSVPSTASDSGATGLISFSYDGTLSGFLDVAAARFGVSWEWESNNSIHIFRYTTKTFRLVALPGDSTLQNTITTQVSGSGGGSGGGGGSSGGTTSGLTSSAGVSISSLSVWGSISDAIKGMLSSKGIVTVSAATGTVTVTDTPQIVAKVEKFIDTQNASLSKQVMVNVRVLSVNLNESDEYGLDWTALRNSLTNYGWQFRNAVSPSINATQLTFNVLPNAAGGAGAWAGSQAVVSALSEQGKVSQVTSTSLMTMNNQPAPLQVGRQTAYLASSTTTMGQTGVTTTLNPGLISTGFSMSLVPHLLDKGKMLLQFAINISSLLNLTTVGTDQSQIQTPDIDTRNFLQRVALHSGDTLILTGFEQARLDAKSSGVGHPSNILLGGNSNGKTDRSILVILIQPVIGNS